jgi:hypothetical protein
VQFKLSEKEGNLRGDIRKFAEEDLPPDWIGLGSKETPFRQAVWDSNLKSTALQAVAPPSVTLALGSLVRKADHAVGHEANNRSCDISLSYVEFPGAGYRSGPDDSDIMFPDSPAPNCQIL